MAGKLGTIVAVSTVSKTTVQIIYIATQESEFSLWFICNLMSIAFFGASLIYSCYFLTSFPGLSHEVGCRRLHVNVWSRLTQISAHNPSFLYSLWIGPTLEMSALLSLRGGNLTLITILILNLTAAAVVPLPVEETATTSVSQNYLVPSRNTAPGLTVRRWVWNSSGTNHLSSSPWLGFHVTLQ